MNIIMKFRIAFINIIFRLGLWPLYARFQRWIMKLRGHLVYVSRLPDISGDFVCDGIHDEVQIQAAIDYVAGRRGKGCKYIELNGVYTLEGSINTKGNHVVLNGEPPIKEIIVRRK